MYKIDRKAGGGGSKNRMDGPRLSNFQKEVLPPSSHHSLGLYILRYMLFWVGIKLFFGSTDICSIEIKINH